MASCFRVLKAGQWMVSRLMWKMENNFSGPSDFYLTAWFQFYDRSFKIFADISWLKEAERSFDQLGFFIRGKEKNEITTSWNNRFWMILNMRPLPQSNSFSTFHMHTHTHTHPHTLTCTLTRSHSHSHTTHIHKHIHIHRLTNPCTHAHLLSMEICSSRRDMLTSMSELILSYTIAQQKLWIKNMSYLKQPTIVIPSICCGGDLSRGRAFTPTNICGPLHVLEISMPSPSFSLSYFLFLSLSMKHSCSHLTPSRSKANLNRMEWEEKKLFHFIWFEISRGSIFSSWKEKTRKM